MTKASASMYAGHPLLDRDPVQSILVVKVDHIGDFITSLPAIRRLKAAFPAARLTALVAPASAAIAGDRARHRRMHSLRILL